MHKAMGSIPGLGGKWGGGGGGKSNMIYIKCLAHNSYFNKYQPPPTLLIKTPIVKRRGMDSRIDRDLRGKKQVGNHGSLCQSKRNKCSDSL